MFVMKIEIDDSKLVETVVKEVAEEIKLIWKGHFLDEIRTCLQQLYRLK